MEDTNETEYVEKSRNSNYTRGNLIIAFLIGAIIGAGVYYLIDTSEALNFTKKRDIDTEKEVVIEKKDDSDTNVIVIDKKVSSESSIVVKDQIAGLRVVIDSITLEGSGWVAVHEDVDGELGNILGAQRFDAGTYKGLVDLLRNTVEGGVYHAVLYSDDGDKVFDHKKDFLLTDENGNTIESEFNAVRIR